MIDLDKPLSAFPVVVGTCCLWMASTVLFLIGIISTLPPEDTLVQALVIMCILIAQVYSIKNYWKGRTPRLILVIAAIFFWALSFMLRSTNLIATGTYAVAVVSFVMAVVFIRSKK